MRLRNIRFVPREIRSALIFGDSDVGDMTLVTIVGCWCQNFDVVDIF